MSIAISDFVNFTIETPGQALGAFNTNVLALLTKDAPVQNYGTGGGGTATVTAGAVSAVAVAAAGAGYTTPPPVFVTGGGGTGALVQAVIAGGLITGFTVIYGGTGYATPPTIVIGNGFQIYVDPIQVGLDFGTSSETYALAEAVFNQSPNVLSGNGYLVVYSMAAGDTLSTAITALCGILYCGGFIWGGYAPNTAEILAASTLVQGLSPKRMLFAPTTNLSDLYAGGMCYQVSALLQTWTRLLIHTASALQARLFAAAYASRLMSVDFSGSNTTLTMNLKQLVGIPADLGINETVFAQCQTVGVDFYAQVATLSETVSTGGNDYSDNVYNLTWLLGALQVATFNGLAQTPTKIPQTEQGMNTVKGTIIGVLNQAVANGFLAPGAWTATTFGNPTSLISNIADFGFYVYSAPVALQLQAQRQKRIAPLIQIAVKYAGAIQQISGIIYINP